MDQNYHATVPPIVQTSNFIFHTVEDLSNALQDEYSDYLYTRGRNPTVDELRKELAILDGAEDCLVVNSGATAIYLSVCSQVKSGDHIIAVKGVYAWAQKLFDHILPRFGVTTTYVDGGSIIHFDQVVRPNTRLVYLESPTSWVFEEQDLQAIAQWARIKNITTIVDNTYYTPLFRKPLSMGIDIAIQSASKYIGGHSDTIGGVICANAEIIRKMFLLDYLNIGAGIMPFNAWLLLRGLRTLGIRLDTIRRNASEVLSFLSNHPSVEKILKPRELMGMFTFILNADSRGGVIRFCESSTIPMAVSWGGHESVILPRCASLSREEFDAKNKMHRAVRIYVGLEDPAGTIELLKKALVRS